MTRFVGELYWGTTILYVSIHRNTKQSLVEDSRSLEDVIERKLMVFIGR